MTPRRVTQLPGKYLIITAQFTIKDVHALGTKTYAAFEHYEWTSQ